MVSSQNMGLSNRLQHPGWAGVVLPIALTVASTFTPSTVRFCLLVAAVGTATWVFHKTEFAGQKYRKTIPAALLFLLVAAGVFFIGRRFDAALLPNKTTQTAVATPGRGVVQVPSNPPPQELPPDSSPKAEAQGPEKKKTSRPPQTSTQKQKNSGGNNAQQQSSGDNSPNVTTFGNNSPVTLPSPPPPPENGCVENAGKMEGNEIDNCDVTASPGGNATAIKTLPGGETSGNKIVNPHVSGPPASAPATAPIPGVKPPTEMSGGSHNLVLDVEVCGFPSAVHAGGTNDSNLLKNIVVNGPSCDWHSFLDEVLKHRDNVAPFLDEWGKTKVASWSSLPLEKSEEFRTELDQIVKELIVSASDNDKFNSVMKELWDNIPSFMQQQK